jgi:hypothetical protein
MTSCTSDATEDTSSSSDEVSQEINPSPRATADAGQDDIDTPSPSTTIERKSASAPSETQPSEIYESRLEGMTEEDSLPYTGSGSGPLAGTRFQTPNGAVHCQMTPNAVACTVLTNEEDWPADQRKEGPNVGSNGPADTVGWSEMVEVPMAGQPMNWQQVDGFPSVETGLELPDQHKFIIPTGFEDSDPDSVCGVDDNTTICTVGEHGFALSETVYETW